MAELQDLFFEPSLNPLLTPIWATPTGGLSSDSDAAFAAGGCLGVLDRIAGSEAPWLGAWRYRLAIKAADASLTVMGRTSAAGDVRDAWYLRKSGSDVGPAGRMLTAWRRLCERKHPPDVAGLKNLARLMDLPWSSDMEGLSEELSELGSVRSIGDMIMEALRITHRRAPAATPLVFWMGDLILAKRMRWSTAVPILSLRMSAVEMKYPRFSPVGEDAVQRMYRALANGAVEACRVGASMEKRSDALLAALPGVRTKGAEKLARALLIEDAVPGFSDYDGISRFAVRRFMERLEQSGAVSELSGRATFRLYGL